MKTVLQNRVGLIHTLIRRKPEERGSLPTGPRQAVAPAGSARRSVTKRSRSATTACVATLSVQDMRTRSRGRKKVLRRHHQHYRRKSACLPPRYQLTTQDVMFAIRCTFLIVNPLRSPTRILSAVMVCDPDLSVSMDSNANRREFRAFHDSV